MKSDPFIEIEYENKEVERIVTTKLTIVEILDIVQSKAQEMDTGAKLAAAGFQGQQLVSPWLRSTGRELDVGTTAHVPRQ